VIVNDLRERSTVLLINTIKVQPVSKLESRDGLDLHVVTEPAFSEIYGSRWTVHLVDDVDDLTEIRRTIFSLLKNGPIDFVVGASERSLQAAGYVRSLLALPGARYEAASLASNKFAMKSMLRDAGVPVAPFALVGGPGAAREAGDMLGWPVVLKPILGAGSKNIFRMNGPEDCAIGPGWPVFKSLAETDLPVIVEHFVDMEWEFHCEGVVQNGDIKFAAAARSLLPRLEGFGKVNGSYCLPPESIEFDEIVRLYRRTIEALGIRDAVTHMEGFRTAGDYLLGEITIRPAGGAIPDLILAQYSVDLWDAFLAISLGEKADLIVHRDPKTCIEFWIPPVAGEVQSITARREIEEMPGVISARVALKTGDISPGPQYSWSYAVQVIAHADADGDVMGPVERLVEIFDLTTSPAT